MHPQKEAPTAEYEKKREHRFVFDENTCFETATKKDLFNLLFDCFRVRFFFIGWGPEPSKD